MPAEIAKLTAGAAQNESFFLYQTALHIFTYNKKTLKN